MKKAFITGLLAATVNSASKKPSFDGLANYNYAKGNPTRWRNIKQNLQMGTQKRHRADKGLKLIEVDL